MIEIYIYLVGFCAVLAVVAGFANKYRVAEPFLVITISILLVLILLTPILASLPR